MCPVSISLDSLPGVMCVKFSVLGDASAAKPSLASPWLQSCVYVIQGIYHNHYLWSLWLGCEDIKIALSSTHPDQQLCNKILAFNSRSCTVGKFYWPK